MTREQDLLVGLCEIARVVNALIDHGEHLDILEARRRVFDGDLVRWLSHRYPCVAWCLCAMPTLNQAEILEVFEDMAAARLESKYAVTSNGFCLLAAYCIEGIQILAGT